MNTAQKRKKVRGSFPQVYRYPKAGMTYWEVSARSMRWGLNERKSFNSEKAALDYAEQIAEQIEKRGSVADVPKEKIELADRYEKLVEKLAAHGKTPEDAVSHYLTHLGSELLKQAKPFLKELIDQWEKEKLNSKIHPLGKRGRIELKSYARYLRRTFGEDKGHEVTRKMVEDALNNLNVGNRNTVKQYLRWIRTLFIWLKDHRHISENPTDGIKIKGQTFEARYYPPERTKAILRFVCEHEKDLIGYYALLTFAGLRPTEGARVQWNDIDFETGEHRHRKRPWPRW